MKELNERQRAEHASRMYEQQKSLFRQLEDRNFELEHKFAEVAIASFHILYALFTLHWLWTSSSVQLLVTDFQHDITSCVVLTTVIIDIKYISFEVIANDCVTKCSCCICLLLNYCWWLIFVCCYSLFWFMLSVDTTQSWNAESGTWTSRWTCKSVIITYF